MKMDTIGQQKCRHTKSDGCAILISGKKIHNNPMTKHPTADWEWEDTAEVAFQEWFNGEYGNFTFRCEWFFGDCEVEDVNTRKDLMTKWLHSAFLTGYNTGRCSKTDD